MNIKIYLKTLLAAVLMAFSYFGAFTQNFRYPVVARIIQKAPYPIFLSDYANPAQQNFAIRLEVRDDLLPVRRVKLKLFIQGRGLNIQSTPTVRGEQVITLAAGQTYDLPADLTANYFENYNLTIAPNQYASNLPEGSYQFGIQVIDAVTGQGLSGVQYAAPVWIAVNEPPVWILPDNFTTLPTQRPQNVNFQWAPRHKNVTDVEYEFSLVELNVPLNYSGNIQNLFLSQPPIYTIRTRSTNVNYNYALPPLIPGKIYAYRVQAIAKAGLEEIGLFRNGGLSEIQWFRYVEPLLPPFNEIAQRKTNQDLLLQWSGYENDLSYEIRIREKGEAVWESYPVDKFEATTGANLYQKAIKGIEEGTYELQIGNVGEFYQSTVFTDVFAHRDSLTAPFNLRASWLDSTTASLLWNGSNAHKDFEIEYRSTHETIWRSFRQPLFEDYIYDETYYEFGSPVTNLNSDVGYLFRVKAFDIDKREVMGDSTYLANKETEEQLLKLKTKTLSGSIKWAFLFEESLAGRTSGTAQGAWETSGGAEQISLLHQKTVTASETYPFENVSVAVFADSTCNILLKYATTNDFGNFDIEFPAEALRGGLVPPTVYLRFKHPAFGEYKKAVDVRFSEDEKDIGEWLIPAPTYRLKPVLLGNAKEFSSPTEHSVSVYRRVSSLETAPYLKYENFRNPIVETERINNEDYFKIGEVKPGETINGIFYSLPEFKHELLLKTKGPNPYLTKLNFTKLLPQNGVVEHTVPINQKVGVPTVFGLVKDLSGKRLSNSAVELRLLTNGRVIGRVFVNNNFTYEINVPLSEFSLDQNYEIQLYAENQLEETRQFSLNRKERRTQQNFGIRRTEMVATLFHLLDSDGKPIRRADVKINGISQRVSLQGWVSGLVRKGRPQRIEIRRSGYPVATHTIDSDSGYSPFSGSQSSRKVAAALVKSLGEYQVAYPGSEVPRYQSSGGIGIFTHPPGYYLITKMSLDISKILTAKRASLVGTKAYRLVDETKPKEFDLNLLVVDKSTRRPLSSVQLIANSLDVVGRTDAGGNITVRSNLNSGHQEYELKPGNTLTNAAGLKYGDVKFSYKFPDLNYRDSLFSENLTIEIEAGSVVRGIVYQKNTETPVPNARVNIEFPGLDTYVLTNENGEYTYRFKNTDEENFLTLTATAESYRKRTVYMAVSQKYGVSYTRDIYVTKQEVVEEGSIAGVADLKYEFAIFGFPVTTAKDFITPTEAERLKERAMASGQTFYSTTFASEISGTLMDLRGRKYNFEDVPVELQYRYNKNNGAALVTLKKVLSQAPNGEVGAILLTTDRENRFLMDEIPIADEEPLYLTTSRTGADYTNPLQPGIIYFKNLNIDHARLTEELSYVINNANLDFFNFWFYRSNRSTSQNRGIIYENRVYANVNTVSRPFPVTLSFLEEPIVKLQFTAKSNADDHGAINELKNYYPDGNDRNKLERLLSTPAGETPTGMYHIDNTAFKSLSFSNKGGQINGVVVMPLMGIPDVEISMMDIPFVRLADNQIKEILIDYSRSPRTISMGDKFVRAQIEEVIVEEDGVDVIYFTEEGLNVIEPETPDMTTIFYNANGIFYSNYRTQREIVQTAAVLNEVEMMGIPEPAMGPGSRIKIAATAPEAAFRTGSADRLLDHLPKFASLNTLSSPTSAYLAANETTLKLEGDADITIDPHTLTTTWKYNKTDSAWKFVLKKWKATSFWGDVLPPIQFDLKSNSQVASGSSDTSRTTLSYGLESSELKVVYNVSVPLISTFEMECEAKYNKDSARFIRNTTSAKGSFRVPSVFEIKAGATIFYDDQEKVSGVFASLNGNCELLEAEIGGAGGYVCVPRNGTCDAIVGGQLSAGSEAGIGPRSFKMYNLKLGFLYDGAGDALFFQIATSLGIGREKKIPQELVQLTADPKSDSTAKADRKKAKAEKVTNLENTKSESQRQSELDAATDDFSLKKRAKESKKRAKEAAEKEVREKQAALLKAKMTPAVTKQQRQDREAAIQAAESDLRSAKSTRDSKRTEYNDANSEYKDAKTNKKEAQKSVDELKNAKKSSRAADKASDEANRRLEKRKEVDKTMKIAYKAKVDSAGTRVRNRSSKKIKGFKKVLLEELFIVGTGRSPFEPKDHPVSLNNIEVTLTISSRGGWTITGAGELALNSNPLFSVGFLVNKGNNRSTTSDSSDFRVFVAMPSFERPQVGPLVDLKADAQLDIGSKNEKFNIFLMGAASADIQVHPIVYVRASVRLVFGLNAQTDSKTLEDNTVAGGTALSETARKIVKFMGSSFNEIAEGAINQRKAFFGAIPKEFIAKADSTFSGFYIGAKGAVMLGFSRDVDVKYLLSGSARIGIGAELSAGILKSIGTDSWEMRFSLAPVVEAKVRLRSPVDEDLIDVRLVFSQLCLATGYNAIKKEHTIKVLYNILKFDNMIGYQVTPGTVQCNQFGLFYVKPCIFMYLKYDSTEPNESERGGFYLDTKLDEDVMSKFCPIEW